MKRAADRAPGHSERPLNVRIDRGGRFGYFRWMRSRSLAATFLAVLASVAAVGCGGDKPVNDAGLSSASGSELEAQTEAQTQDSSIITAQQATSPAERQAYAECGAVSATYFLNQNESGPSRQDQQTFLTDLLKVVGILVGGDEVQELDTTTVKVCGTLLNPNELGGRVPASLHREACDLFNTWARSQWPPSPPPDFDGGELWAINLPTCEKYGYLSYNKMIGLVK